ncbi:uncharacterized protein LOC132948823 isoform X2 [Metopolophium dirhodum]|nr:uncharacterized protein LOC132948823 isoform X2 [Metopolophium dirhodum]
MLCETDLDDAEMHDGNNSSIHRAYRTPNERKAQERLFQSLKPKTLDPSKRSHQRKQSKRPDIPIYIPKALRGLANKTVSNTTSTNNSSDSTPSNKLNANCRVQDDSSNTLYSKDKKGSMSLLNLDQHNNIVLASLNSFKFVDLSNEMFINDVNNEFKTSYCDSSQFSDSLSSSILPDSVDINGSNSNSSITNQIINIKNPNLEDNELESNTTINNCDSVLTRSENVDCISIQNSTSVNLPDRQILDVNDKITTDDALLPQKTTKSMDPFLVDDNISDMSNNQLDELHKRNEVVFSSGLEIELKEEHNTNCPHYCLDDSFTSGPLTDVDENYPKNLNEELTVQQSPVLINKSLEILEINEKKKEKKKKKKKILDVDECSWEDMYDKEDDYIHPLLMKELVSTIGKVQVQCAKEDYRSYQTIEERSGDGECVIEVYGFSSELKTIDLMNQFAAFRKKHFEIIWVDDTHALAVFESPHLADQALNTPLALVKTRPLKNATKESKLRAATVVALPATRPKTCTAMARRLVSSALGLKMNVSPDLINAERTLLANAKEKKIRDAQQKHDIWNNES